MGHVRNASAAFVAEQDGSGESLFLAAECLELEGLFADLGVVPELVDPGLGPVESLEAASRALADVSALSAGSVPLELWAGVEALRARVSR